MRFILSLAIGFMLVFTPYIAQAAQGIPADNTIEFEILRGGKPFGTHEIKFDKAGEQVTTLITIKMRYKAMGVTLFRYDHTNKEQWQGNKLISVNAVTDDDGRDYKVQKDNLKNIYSSSYWNIKSISGTKILNTQYGTMDDIKVTKLASRKIDVAGKTINADVYKVDTTVPITVMYDKKTKQWVGLEFTARGAAVEYRRKDAL